jgi:hypothetical protein
MISFTIRDANSAEVEFFCVNKLRSFIVTEHWLSDQSAFHEQNGQTDYPPQAAVDFRIYAPTIRSRAMYF